MIGLVTNGKRMAHGGLLFSLAIALFLGLAASPASAAKHAIDFIGNGPGFSGGEFPGAAGVAVNQTGAGGVPPGTIYVIDGGNFDDPGSRGNRVQRFQREDNGTPSDRSDDTYPWVSAWGAGVDGGGTDFEICTVAVDCVAGSGGGGNGTSAGNGSLNKPGGIAVDQDTGDVYVADTGPRRTPDDHYRVNVYSATGEFLRSFGWDVVESGPSDNGTGYEICKADIDVCKAGLPGSGNGQIGSTSEDIAVSPPDGNLATGNVFLPHGSGLRVNVYNLDGSSPTSFATPAAKPEAIAVDSRGIVYLTERSAAGDKTRIERYDTQNANGGGVGLLAPIPLGVNEQQTITVSADAGQFRLSFGGDSTPDLPYDASAGAIEKALGALPAIGGEQHLTVFNGKTEPGEEGVRRHLVTFVGRFAVTDVEELGTSNGTVPLSGGSGASVTTSAESKPGLIPGNGYLAVDSDADGPGPDADVLYAARTEGTNNAIQQFGPVNSPGLSAPPVIPDEIHAQGDPFTPTDFDVEPSTGRIYVGGFNFQFPTAFGGGNGVYVLDDAGPPPTASLDALSGETSHSVVAHLTIDPNGPPATSYRLEYSDDGVEWVQTPTVVLGTQDDPQELTATLDPPGGGLLPNTTYQVRLFAARKLTIPIVTSALSFTTLEAPPIAETTGSPLRTATTARLEGRVAPRLSATTYHFEYGDQGPCSVNSCTATETHAAGSGAAFRPVSQWVEGLQPDTTYHYRLVADNGNAGSPVFGEDMTTTTRTSDAPLSHGHLPGPAGSDRAWEQVNLPDTGGNPVRGAESVSDSGERVVYRVAGGTPISKTATLLSQLYAERTPAGWRSENLHPPRAQLAGNSWFGPAGRSDLSDQIAFNFSNVTGANALWRLRPGQPAALVFQGSATNNIEELMLVSADSSRVLALVSGSHDPDHPVVPNGNHLYDVSTPGSPRLTNLLPGGAVPDCGIPSSLQYGLGRARRSNNWVSADGALAFFPSGCFQPQLYVRDFAAEQTQLISGPPVSGKVCGAAFIKSNSDAVFLWTKTRLSPDDTDPSDCDNVNVDGDVYRYDLDTGELDCVTCVVAGLDGDVPFLEGQDIAVAPDGSRVYFRSPHALVPGAAETGIYRVEVESGDLEYVAQAGGTIGEDPGSAEAITPDGSVITFVSSAASLNALGGQQNGGTSQYYRYDDRNGSLICVSCPQNGSAPLDGVNQNFAAPAEAAVHGGANKTAVSADGKTFAFATRTPLVGGDQNTPPPGQDPIAGTDVYEWRDGRLLLVTDGLTHWPTPPFVSAVSPSGRDIFFVAATQYTPDALDSYARLYDARIGGGFEFPAPPRPCPLEVCQGTPKGAPEEPFPASAALSGSGNASKPFACAKGKVRRRGRCVVRSCAKGKIKRQSHCVKRRRGGPHRPANDDGRTDR